MTRFLLIVIMLCALGGCSTVGLTSSFCDPQSGIRPIRLTATERAALASEPKRDILAINGFGARNCGWKS